MQRIEGVGKLLAEDGVVNVCHGLWERVGQRGRIAAAAHARQLGAGQVRQQLGAERLHARALPEVLGVALQVHHAQIRERVPNAFR